MHRVRQSLPYLAELGWEATVLASDPAVVDGPVDPDLLATIPPETDVRRVGALDYRWTRRLGLGNLALRSLPAMARAGRTILDEAARAGRPYSLVYFSTTQFPVTVLGPRWRRQTGTRYVVDLQDPWRPDHYLGLPRRQQPPKFWLAYRVDKALEPLGLARADGYVSVSAAYPETLRQRYPGAAPPERCLVLPFGGPAADFDVLDRLALANPFFDPSDGCTHAVYAGRGGHDMAIAARALFGAVADGLRSHPALYEPLRLHFVGTDYAPDGRGTQRLKPLADALGLGSRVAEHTDRVPYFQALHLLRQADLTVVPGSDDPAYTASKLYPYILARRPLVAVFNAASSVVDVLAATGAGVAVTFETAPDEVDLRARVGAALTETLSRLPFTPATDWAAFEPYTAREMARRQVEFFDHIVALPAVARR